MAIPSATVKTSFMLFFDFASKVTVFLHLQVKTRSSWRVKVRNDFIPSIFNTVTSGWRMEHRAWLLKQRRLVAQRNNRCQTLAAQAALFFRRIMVLFGSFIGLADTKGGEKIWLMNTPCLLSIGFSLFAYCIMALEISHYFLPGAFQKMFCHSSQQSCVHRELFYLVYTCWGFAQAFIFRNISRKEDIAVNSGYFDSDH